MLPCQCSALPERIPRTKSTFPFASEVGKGACQLLHPVLGAQGSAFPGGKLC